MIEPSSSRRMVRGSWSGGASDGEARAYLQARLTVLYRLMFFCFLVLLVFLRIGYTTYPEIEPAAEWVVEVCFSLGLVTMAVIWRGMRRPRSLRWLRAIDTFYTFGVNTSIAICAIASFEQRQAVYTCLLYSSFAMLTRALIVPSTGKRTAIVTTLAGLPMAVAAVVLAAITAWPGPKDVPAPGFVVGFLMIEIVTILLAAAGSQIIYGLRRQVTAAQQLGQYTLGREIDTGGLGSVYLAHHAMLRRPTAVKLLRADRVGQADLERFEREVQEMSQLTHPNTVAVYDYGRSADGLFYYAMEYLGRGIGLAQLVRNHGPQPAERVRQVLVQICGALQEAHDRKLYHRDVKPSNVILCERGAVPDVVKVVNFGLVKEIDGAPTAGLLGTAGYVAPEVIRTPQLVSAAADLYAVGCVGYFLLVGRGAFSGETTQELCRQHLTELPARPSDVRSEPVPRALEDLILRCLAKRPGDRHASAAELGAALGASGPFHDWDEARALAWWGALPPDDRVDGSAAPTMTIAVDVMNREHGDRRGSVTP